MSEPNTRREFLKHGTAATVGLMAAGAGAAGAQQAVAEPKLEGSTRAVPDDRTPPEKLGKLSITEFSRWQPSFGGPPESDNYLGKLVGGLRDPGLEPVPFVAPDLTKLPFEMKDGVREFHLTCEPVKRELLPGYHMNFYGYNGSMPGPTIEAFQGDRVRIVVHNRLPEPTTVHWHGLELPVAMDGVDAVTQDFIPPGGHFVYEFDLHQTGTFFYHSHDAMQEAFGMVGFFIIHPRVAFDPPVDRDFGLLFQNFRIEPTRAVPDSWSMEWNWHTINGRSGPYTTPLVCRLGERVRIRILNFSVEQHHPVHLHGHTFWITGHEGVRIPPSLWQPRNTELIAVAQSADLEFIAFNPGDWVMHCHMFHHMMNHMTRHVGPRIREGVDVSEYKKNLDDRPSVKFPHTDKGFATPGYPQHMQHPPMPKEAMQKIMGRREVRGMRAEWHTGVMGLMTVVRVLPHDLYDKVMHGDEDLHPGISVPGSGGKAGHHVHQPMSR